MLVHLRAGVAALCLLFAFAGTTWAEPWSRTVSGHRVAVAPGRKALEEVLTVDGKVVHRNAFITIEEATSVGGAHVVVGSSSNGGNACDGSPFVLSFQRGGRLRLDGPLKSCKSVTHDAVRGGIRFQSLALEGDPGQAWLWTPSRGFKFVGLVRHVPDPKRGWADLRADKALHPSELLDLGEVAPTLLALLGRDRRAVLPLLNGVGSGAFVDDLYVGSACRPHACMDTGVLVLADPKARKLYVAWKLERRKIQMSAAIAKWPPAARVQLKKWMKSWR